MTFRNLIDNISSTNIITGAYQFANYRFSFPAATKQLETLITQFNFTADQLFEFLEFGFVADKYGAYQPIKMNDAFFIIALCLVDKNDLFIFRVIRTIRNTKATQIKTMDLDNIHQRSAKLGAID